VIKKEYRHILFVSNYKRIVVDKITDQIVMKIKHKHIQSNYIYKNCVFESLNIKLLRNKNVKLKDEVICFDGINCKVGIYV
jgi:hypothetical protein